MLSFLLCPLAAAASTRNPSPRAAAVTVPSSPPANAYHVTGPFVSYAVEYSTFLQFAYSDAAFTQPNTYSDQMNANIGFWQGSKPVWRVGGNSQDLHYYNASQTLPLRETSALPGPTNAATPAARFAGHITGPSFYNSFEQWTNTPFIFGFNQADNQPSGATTLTGEVDLMCKILNNNTNGNTAFLWEFGNEPDVYDNNNYRNWGGNAQLYANDWLNGVNSIKKQWCTSNAPKFVGLSMGLYGGISDLGPVIAAGDNISSSSDVSEWTLHLYQGNSAQAALQGWELSHQHVVDTWSERTTFASRLKAVDNNNYPVSIDESNDILNVGEIGISDVFGGALWQMDWLLTAASTGVISRVHMQMGGNGFTYNSWYPQTVTTGCQASGTSSDITECGPAGTRPKYYGDIAAAAAIGNTANGIQIANVSISSNNDLDSGYLTYREGHLARISVINFAFFSESNTGTRPSTEYTFSLPSTCTSASALPLFAPGADTSCESCGKSTSGNITFNGQTYELSNGGQASVVNTAMHNVPLTISNHQLTLTVPYSSAMVVELAGC